MKPALILFMAPHLKLSSLIISLGGKELGRSEEQLFYVAMLKKRKRKEKAQERRSEGKLGSQISPIYVKTLIHADLIVNCFVK